MSKRELHLSRPRLSFLSLPPQVRRQIYELSLRSTSNQIMILGAAEKLEITCGRHREAARNHSIPLNPALLRVCRAIHVEAAPVLYEANIFQFSYPVKVLEWINVIGATNAGFLQKLRVFVEAVVRETSRDSWIELFKKLGREAKGLRWMYIYFDQEGMHRGLGHDEKLVRALAELKSLDNSEIGGFFSRYWPDYLERNISARVLRT